MQKKLMTALLISVTAGAASGQVAATSGINTNASGTNASTTYAAPASGAPTNAILTGQDINEPGTFGLGALVGEPLGLSAKVWLSEKFAVDGGLGWSFVDPDGCQIHGDFLFHKFDLLQPETRDLPLYFGVGGRVKFVEHGDNRAGVRVPFGIAYLMPQKRLEFFAEVAPILDVAPTTTLEWNGGVGVRYYFKH